MADDLIPEDVEGDSEDVFIEMEDIRDEDAPLVYPDPDGADAANLVALWAGTEKGDEALKEVSRQVREKFDTDYDASGEFRKKKADEWAIFSGDLPPKREPWKNCANAHVPIALETISRLSFRATAEIFGDWSTVVGVLPVGPDDKVDAEIMSKHDNWQISEQIRDFRRQQYRGVLQFYMNGDVSCHSYYDPDLRTNCHEILTCDELVLPYVHVSTMPDYSDLPHLTKILRMSKHQLEKKIGIWYGVKEVIDGAAPSPEDEPESLLADAEMSIQGVEKPDIDGYGEFKLLQWEGWMGLPDQKRQKFIQAIVHQPTEKVLYLIINEEEDPLDRLRYDRQVSELEQWRIGTQQHKFASTIVEEATEQLVNDPNIGTVERAQKEQEMSAIQMPPPLPPPGWLKDPEDENEKPDEVRVIPVHMFSHGVCIEPLTGAYGLGFGRIEADYNRGANVALSQFIDAASVSNSRGIITTDLLTWNKALDLSPGATNTVSGVIGSELRDNIMPLEYGPANPQLMEVVNKLKEWGESAIQAPAVLSGESGKSGETAQGLLTRVEQATRQMSESTKRYAEFFTQIMKCNQRLNSIFLPDEQVLQINNHLAGSGEMIRINRALWNRDYRITFHSDLKFTPEAQKIQEADAVLQLALAIPMLAMNVPFLNEVIKKNLKARGQDDLIPAADAAAQAAMQAQAAQAAVQTPGQEGAPAEGGPPQA